MVAIDVVVAVAALVGEPIGEVDSVATSSCEDSDDNEAAAAAEEEDRGEEEETVCADIDATAAEEVNDASEASAASLSSSCFLLDAFPAIR